MPLTLEASHPATTHKPAGTTVTTIWWWRSLLLLALVVFAVAATYQIQLPGLNYDEALDAVPAMNSVLGQPVHALASVSLGGRSWPLAVMPYIGPISSFLLMPGFALAGVSVATLRLATVVLGGLTLLLCWGFLREYLDERAASLAVLFLAVDPTYVFWSRMGGWVALPMLPVFIVALWALFRWYGRRQLVYLVLAAFCLGLGLSTKLLFIWAWVALALAWLLLTPWLERQGGWRRWLWPVRGLSVSAIALAILTVVLGSGIIIWYNLPGGGTFHFIAADILSGSIGSVSLAERLSSIPRIAMHDVSTLLDGSWFKEMIGGPYHNALAVPAFLASCAIVCGLALAGKLKYNARRLVLLALLMVSFAIMGSAASISWGANHLVLIWPIPQVFVAVACLGLADLVSELAPRRQWAWLGAIGLMALVLVGGEIWTTYRYQATLAKTGGKGHFSAAIYELGQDLEQPGTPRVVAMDWGFLRNLEFLSQGRIDVIERFTYTSPPGDEFAAYLEDLVKQPDALFLFHAPKYTAFPGHWEMFDRAAYRHRLTPALLRTYRQSDGEPVYQVYRLVSTPALQALPSTARPMAARFGQSINLLGYDLPAAQVPPGETLQGTVYWQASEPQTHSYKVFAHLLDENGKQWAIHDSVPYDWSYPTTSWRPGELVADRIWLPIGPDTPPGTYRLLIGMYDEKTGQRLPFRQAAPPQSGDTLEIAVVQVAPNEP